MVTFRQRFVHAEANLQFPDCGQYELPAGSRSSLPAAPGRKRLLFMWKGSVAVELSGCTYAFATNDTLYIPLGGAFRLENSAAAPACVIQTSAPAERVHPVSHTPFAELSRREDRIRRLKGTPSSSAIRAPGRPTTTPTRRRLTSSSRVTARWKFTTPRRTSVLCTRWRKAIW